MRDADTIQSAIVIKDQPELGSINNDEESKVEEEDESVVFKQAPKEEPSNEEK